MASSQKNLSDFSHMEVPSCEGWKFAVIVAEWNHVITSVLAQGAVALLEKQGAKTEDISLHHVPGSFELVQGARLAVFTREFDAVICIGCVIKGDTPHFDYICQGVTQGLANLNTLSDTPVIYGVLTVLDEQQALDRAGGKHGNKGEEAAVTAIKMVKLKKEILHLNDKKHMGFYDK